jgi:EAL domain-containing protein (putative c-di-GMP-specific phosphodiesterase class I)
MEPIHEERRDACPRKSQHGGVIMAETEMGSVPFGTPSPRGDNAPAAFSVMSSDPRRITEVENLILDSLKNGGFEIYYQPLYNVYDGNFTEAEALLRLHDRNGRFVSPDEFIPIAEKSGLIMDIGNFVLDGVCKYIRNMLKCSADIDTISVNLSVVQLMQDNVVSRLMDIIRRNGISPNRILFEVTESTLVSDYEQIGEKLREMNEQGVQFALDDFGTGYSNITHVIDMPFDVVKIDKSLIWDSVKSRRCNIMIRELTKTFKDINLSVIAEGVETKEHDDFVRQCNCDKIQGFRYARPMPISQASDYFGRKVG